MQKQMNSAKHFLSVLLILTIFSGCKDKPPVIEQCIFGEENGVYDWVCLDKNIEEEPRVEPVEYGVNFICASPDNYRIMESWVVEKLKELEQCQSKKSY